MEKKLHLEGDGKGQHICLTKRWCISQHQSMCMLALCEEVHLCTITTCIQVLTQTSAYKVAH